MKAKIISKSEELFLSLGFKNVTMDEIANAMGISKKTIYAHFPNKVIGACGYFFYSRIHS